jgi:hypothetical protein
MKTKSVFFILMVLIFATSSAWAVGPGTSNTAVSGSGAESIIVQTDNSKTTVYDRKFVNTPGAPGVRINAYLSDHENSIDPDLRGVAELLQFGNIFSKSALENLAAGGDVKVNFPVVKNILTKPSNVLTDGQPWLMIIIEKPTEQFFMSAPVDARADDNDTTSFMVIAQLGLDAIANGDNVLYLTAEGFQRKIAADGWALGAYATGAGTSDGGTGGGAGGMGLGIGGNETGPEHRPWVKGYSGHFDRQLVVQFPLEAIKEVTKSDGKVFSLPGFSAPDMETDDGFSRVRLVK